MPGNRTTQHHCPQCFAIAKPRCFDRGHLVCCPVHNAYHSPYSNCVQCEGAARRAERVARKDKDGDGKGSSGKGRNKRTGSEEGMADKAGGKKSGKLKA